MDSIQEFIVVLDLIEDACRQGRRRVMVDEDFLQKEEIALLEKWGLTIKENGNHQVEINW